jgi:hypothetical protein
MAGVAHVEERRTRNADLDHEAPRERLFVVYYCYSVYSKLHRVPILPEHTCHFVLSEAILPSEVG